MQYISDIASCLTVIITALYLAATIVICVFNGKSAAAAREQTEEIKKQFYAVNRPVLTVDAVFLRKNLLALRLKNEGNQTALKTQVILQEDFINSLPEKKFRDYLENESERTRTVGVGQNYDMFFGSDAYIALENKKPIIGQIEYTGISGLTYTDDFEIDIESYLEFYIDEKTL